jgi:hypothetical protein
MGSDARRILRRTPLFIVALLAAALVAVPAAAAAPLSISIVGNHFVNGEGQTIRLLGVDRTSSEYGCVDGFGYDDGHFDAADAAAIAAWGANAVRVPLNEDCWLGINGQPNSSQGAEPPLTKAGYQQEIENYVAALNAHGIYAILDLHWTAPGAQVALEQQPMPDFAHSPAFWTSVAGAFKNTPGVVFDAFNEPYDPTDPRSGEDQTEADKVTWGCWATGTKPDPIGGGAPPLNCETQAYDENGNPTTRYRIAGMQTLIEAIRATGATQPILAGGLNFADDLSGWLTHKPVDPLNQLAASFHNYMGEGKCDNVGCWNSQIAPVAASVPVVTGEFAEDNYANPTCTEGPNNFDNEYMGWADEHGVSYLAWAWVVETAQEIAEEGCSAYYLISDYAGTPASVNGIAVHNHLLALATKAAGTPPAGGGTTPITTPGGKTIKLTKFAATVLPGDKVRLQLVAAQSCKATIAGQTVKAFRLGKGKPRKLGLGTAHASLTANKPTTVTMALPAKARGLLKSNGSLRASYAINLGGSSTTDVVTLKQPKPKKPKH